MDNEDVRGKDSCNKADGKKEYRREDRTTARRRTRRTAKREAAARRIGLRSTA